jgi:hypothetical protein
VLIDLHVELPQRYDTYKVRRLPGDDRLFLFADAFADGGLMHRFAFTIDDSTSATTCSSSISNTTQGRWGNDNWPTL